MYVSYLFFLMQLFLFSDQDLIRSFLFVFFHVFAILVKAFFQFELLMRLASIFHFWERRRKKLCKMVEQLKEKLAFGGVYFLDYSRLGVVRLSCT